jgi:hypothetical protein
MEILTRTASGYDFDDTASSASSCVDDDERAYGGRRRFDDSDSDSDSEADSEADNEIADPHSYWTSTAAAVTPAPVAETQNEENTDAVKDCGDEDDHKFGLCFRCACGLDDRADFVNCKYATTTRLFCNDCFSRMY